MPDFTLLKASAYAALQQSIANGLNTEAQARQQGDDNQSAALRDSGVLSLVNVAGTGDAITADFLPSLAAVGITSPSVESKVGFNAVQANSNPNPTITIGTVNYPIRDADGGTWPAGGFVVGRNYILRRRNTVLRVISGDVSVNDLGNGRVWHTSDSNISTQTPAIGTDQISVATNAGHITWRRLTSPPVPVDPLIHAQTMDGTWWYLCEDTGATKSRLSAALRDSGILPLTNIGGTGDAITADFLPSLVAAGITTPSVESTVGFIAVATNPNPNPTITIAGTAYPVRDADGAAWPANGFVVGRSYHMRRRNTVMRVISSSGGGGEVSDTAFRTTDPLDEVWYAMMRARDGSPWLGAYPDGSWAAPTVFGSIRWPGDDIVIFETQAGDPILAIAPDGSLIFKQGS